MAATWRAVARSVSCGLYLTVSRTCTAPLRLLVHAMTHWSLCFIQLRRRAHQAPQPGKHAALPHTGSSEIPNHDTVPTPRRRARAQTTVSVLHLGLTSRSRAHRGGRGRGGLDF